MKPLFSEIHIVGGQLSRLRESWEAIYEKYPPNADFANTYITLCTTIEYVIAYHLRSELEALRAYAENTAPDGSSQWISRTDLNGKIHPYDQSRGRDALLRLLDKELFEASKLTYGEMKSRRTLICGESLHDFCASIDSSLWRDIEGLFKLRHVFVHGRPLRLDVAEKSPYNFDDGKFSLQEAVASLTNMGLLAKAPDVVEQANALHDAIFSYEAIQFYWNRVGTFVHCYVGSVPQDLSYHRVMANVLTPLKPLM